MTIRLYDVFDYGFTAGIYEGVVDVYQGTIFSKMVAKWILKQSFIVGKKFPTDSGTKKGTAKMKNLKEKVTELIRVKKEHYHEIMNVIKCDFKRANGG